MLRVDEIMTAFDPLGWLWLLAVAGGALVLGLAIWYGQEAFRRRSLRHDAASEREGRKLYHEGGPAKMDD